MFWGGKLWPGDVSKWERNWKDVEVGSGEDGEACCCHPVITVPLTMVHFSENRRIGGGGGDCCHDGPSH